MLEALGVRIDLKPDAVARCINEVGFGFMFAPAHHGATRFVVPVRKELAVRTIFNFLGPLTNPAGATRQVIGVSDPNFLETIAGALARLGAAQGAGSVQRRRSGRDEHVGRQRASSRSTAATIDAYEIGARGRGTARAPSPAAIAGGDAGRQRARRRGGSSPASRARRATWRRSTPARRSTCPAASAAWRRACAPPRRRWTTARAAAALERLAALTAASWPRSMSVLDRIVDDTRDEVKRRRKQVPLSELEALLDHRAESSRPFSEALTRPGI